MISLILPAPETSPDKAWFFAPTHADLDRILGDACTLLQNGATSSDVRDYITVAVEFVTGWDANPNSLAGGHPLSGIAELILERAVRIVEVSQ